MGELFWNRAAHVLHPPFSRVEKGAFKSPFVLSRFDHGAFLPWFFFMHLNIHVPAIRLLLGAVSCFVFALIDSFVYLN